MVLSSGLQYGADLCRGRRFCIGELAGCGAKGVGGVVVLGIGKFFSHTTGTSVKLLTSTRQLAPY